MAILLNMACSLKRSCDLDGLVGEGFVFLGGAGEEEAVGSLRGSGLDCCDDVHTTEPVSFGEVGGGVLGGVVGVGVVEAYDVQALLAGFALGGDELLGGDVVAVVGAVGAGVAGADEGGNGDGVGFGFAEEDAAAFVGIGFFAVVAEVGVEGLGDDEGHGERVQFLAFSLRRSQFSVLSCQLSVVSCQLLGFGLGYSSAVFSVQKRSERYLSAESQRMVTITAWRLAAASSLAMVREAATAPAAETPTRRPWVLPRRLAMR